MEAMQSQQDNDVAHKVDLLFRAVLGDKQVDPDDEGMRGRINDIEKRMKNFETLRDRLKDRITYLIIGLSIPAGFGISEILSIIAKAISK